MCRRRRRRTAPPPLHAAQAARPVASRRRRRPRGGADGCAHRPRVGGHRHAAGSSRSRRPARCIAAPEARPAHHCAWRSACCGASKSSLSSAARPTAAGSARAAGQAGQDGGSPASTGSGRLDGPSGATFPARAPPPSSSSLAPGRLLLTGASVAGVLKATGDSVDEHVAPAARGDERDADGGGPAPGRTHEEAHHPRTVGAGSPP